MARSAVRPTRWVTTSRSAGSSAAGSCRNASNRRRASARTSRVAELAQNADQAGAQQRAVIGIGTGGVPAEPVEHRAQLGAGVALQRRPLRAAAREVVEPA